MTTLLHPTFWRVILGISLTALIIPTLIISYIVITTEGESVTIDLNTDSFIGIAVVVLYVVLISFFVLACMYWIYSKIHSILNLRKDKLKIELLHLQSQINPHFFFNMLNNLYGLVGKDADEARNMILGLSDMMRYSIYEGQQEKVTLKEEINYLKKYIRLNESRYRKSIDLKFDTKLENEQYKVTPLLFITLVENGFKHGVEHLTRDAFIHVNLKSSGNLIRFEILNNYDPDEQPVEKGMGIANLKRRLELVYPKRHSLIIEQTESTYKAVLQLKTT